MWYVLSANSIVPERSSLAFWFAISCIFAECFKIFVILQKLEVEGLEVYCYFKSSIFLLVCFIFVIITIYLTSPINSTFVIMLFVIGFELVMWFVYKVNRSKGELLLHDVLVFLGNDQYQKLFNVFVVFDNLPYEFGYHKLSQWTFLISRALEVKQCIVSGVLLSKPDGSKPDTQQLIKMLDEYMSLKYFLSRHWCFCGTLFVVVSALYLVMSVVLWLFIFKLYHVGSIEVQDDRVVLHLSSNDNTYGCFCASYGSEKFKIRFDGRGIKINSQSNKRKCIQFSVNYV